MDGYVSPADVCPNCKENRVDFLEIQKDERTVKCCTCGESYELWQMGFKQFIRS